MEQVSARASLLAPNVADREPLTATVSRREIEEALRGDELPDLVLDLTRFSEGEAVETRNVAVAWERGELETLLRETPGDSVTFTFDREQLRQVFEGVDVEAQGLREKVLVLAVVAGTAAAAAGPAQSMSFPNDKEGITSVQPNTTLVAPDDRAVKTPLPNDLVQPVVPQDKVGLVPNQPPLVAPDDRAVKTPLPNDLAQPVVPQDKVGLVPNEPPLVAPDDRAVHTVGPQPIPVATPAPDGGISISAPDPAAVAGIAGALAIAITGAAFVMRGRGRVRPT